MTTEERNRLFDYWMAEEEMFRREEVEACRKNRHDLAASAHAQRWACMDRALKALEADERK